MTSHRITHLPSGIMTERCSADDLRPGNVIVAGDDPSDEHMQAVVVSISGTRTGMLTVHATEVVGLRQVVFTAGPALRLSRIVRQ